jgi:simple sugar transport system ATP-binding protein
MLELRGISKYFPSNGVLALEKAGFTLRPGEIHALLGENGAGKSTLMHIATGYLSPSSGSVLVDGKERRFSMPADALALGIGMVRQHPLFISGLEVWEDCILGAENRNFFLNSTAAKKRAGELSKRWNFNLPLDNKSEALTVSQRQKAAVLSLLLRDVKCFVFDEPTAVLTQDETKNFFRLLERLRDDGMGIVLITHKLKEALAFSDRITVMRHGTSFESQTAATLSIEELSRQILGADLPVESAVSHSDHSSDMYSSRPIILSIRNLKIETPELPFIYNINLEMKAGTITGITGAREAGLETLELALTGLLPGNCKIEGSVTLNGRDILGNGARAFRGAGGAYLGADRLKSNLARSLPLSESLLIHVSKRAHRRIFLDTKHAGSWSLSIMKKAGITRSVSDNASSFSGGMLQRILLSRELAENATLLLLAEPGSGLDKPNRSWLAEELNAYKRRGGAVLLFSTDYEELSSLADKIKILSGGTLSGNMEKE